MSEHRAGSVAIVKTTNLTANEATEDPTWALGPLLWYELDTPFQSLPGHMANIESVL